MHKFSPENKNKLETSERKKRLPPKRILKQLGLRKGDIMADIGCGTGFFTLPAAQIVGNKGSVYALDISREMVEALKEKIEVQKIKNIYPYVSSEQNFKLPEEVISFAFLSNVVHEANDREMFLGEVLRVLQKTGKVAIIEWRKKSMPEGPPTSRRLSSEEVENMLLKKGCFAIVRFSLGANFYAVTAKKP